MVSNCSEYFAFFSRKFLRINKTECPGKGDSNSSGDKKLGFFLVRQKSQGETGMSQCGTLAE
jgi:hypothetical protein